MIYMTEKQAKKAIIEIGQRMYVRDFVAANDGNISIKTGDNEVWATPTGVSKGFMKKKMLVKVDLDGNVLEGTNKPSSELKMHLRAYKENPDILSVCHAHPPICTCFAIAGIPLDAPVLAEAIITLGAEDAFSAYYRLESMEYYAKILLITDKILEKQNKLDEQQVDRLLFMREKFGIKRGGRPVT